MYNTLYLERVVDKMGWFLKHTYVHSFNYNCINRIRLYCRVRGAKWKDIFEDLLREAVSLFGRNEFPFGGIKNKIVQQFSHKQLADIQSGEMSSFVNRAPLFNGDIEKVNEWGGGGGVNMCARKVGRYINSICVYAIRSFQG